MTDHFRRIQSQCLTTLNDIRNIENDIPKEHKVRFHLMDQLKDMGDHHRFVGIKVYMKRKSGIIFSKHLFRFLDQKIWMLLPILLLILSMGIHIHLIHVFGKFIGRHDTGILFGAFDPNETEGINRFGFSIDDGHHIDGISGRIGPAIWRFHDVNLDIAKGFSDVFRAVVIEGIHPHVSIQYPDIIIVSERILT